MRQQWRLRTVLAAIASVVGLLVTFAAPSSAEDPTIVSVERDGPRHVSVTVRSVAMDRTIKIEVLAPADRSQPGPTLYLLNGAGGGEDENTWQARTDVEAFFADKNVNVVIPMEGAFSFYTDWERDDPMLGRNKWSTFLTRELPPVIDAAFNTTGVNAIAGLSMAGTAVLILAIEAPGLYRAVASYSGCAQTSDPLGQLAVGLVVNGRGAGDVTNMWGPQGGPGWVAHDPYVNAERLRGTAVYISSGTGLPGPHDALADEGIDGNGAVLANQMMLGGATEAAVHLCTRLLANRLAALEIPAVVSFVPGTHSWGYWQDDLHRSWPMIAAAIGA